MWETSTVRPGSPSRRPAARSRRALAALAVAATASVTGCAAAAPEPTVPSVSFAPKLVLEITDGGLRWQPGPRADATVSVDPARVPQGTVVDIANRTGSDRRVVGDDGKAFDTGTLRPGETTTLALTTPITAEQTVTVRTRGGPDASTALVVVPRPDAER